MRIKIHDKDRGWQCSLSVAAHTSLLSLRAPLEMEFLTGRGSFSRKTYGSSSDAAISTSEIEIAAPRNGVRNDNPGTFLWRREQLPLSFLTLGVVLLLVIFYGSFFTHPITLVTSDLGRHLQNGRLFFENWHIIMTNFYSYTEPEFSAVNHHWGSGALFYSVWNFFGFMGVQFFVIALQIAAFLISFFLARKRIGTGLAAILAILVIPILGTRTELRPESISYVFAMLFFLTLVRFRDNPLPLYHTIVLLAFFELAWVNAHIYFFLGPLFVFAFLLEAIIVKR